MIGPLKKQFTKCFSHGNTFIRNRARSRCLPYFRLFLSFSPPTKTNQSVAAARLASCHRVKDVREACQSTCAWEGLTFRQVKTFFAAF